MPVFNLHWLGRFGNCCFQYAFARAFCERNGLELRTDPWPGEQIFDIKHEPCVGNLPRKEEFSIRDGDADISYRSYSQQQKCIDYYSVSDCRSWFKFSERAKQIGDAMLLDIQNKAVAHQRRGDYIPLGYPCPSKESYLRAALIFGVDPHDITFIGDEQQWGGLSDPAIDFLPDFYRMCKTANLFRANSSFSFWAGVLNEGRVFAPVIDGLTGGQEHDCDFVEGNWPRLANFEFTTDLIMSP